MYDVNPLTASSIRQAAHEKQFLTVDTDNREEMEEKEDEEELEQTGTEDDSASSNDFFTLRTTEAKVLPKLPSMLTNDRTDHSKMAPDTTHASVINTSHPEEINQPVLNLSFHESNDSDTNIRENREMNHEVLQLRTSQSSNKKVSNSEHDTDDRCKRRKTMDTHHCLDVTNQSSQSGSQMLTCIDHTVSNTSEEQEFRKVTEDKEQESSKVLGLAFSSIVHNNSHSQSSSPSPLGSPTFLPPTPGKEDTTSILKRTGIGFM